MSDFAIIQKDNENNMDRCCGLFKLKISKEDIAALENGLELYGRVYDGQLFCYL